MAVVRLIRDGTAWLWRLALKPIALRFQLESTANTGTPVLGLFAYEIAIDDADFNTFRCMHVLVADIHTLHTMRKVQIDAPSS